MKAEYVGLQCGKCSHWWQKSENVGECHAVAPKATYHDPDIDDYQVDGYGMVMWLRTHKSDGCGQFAARAALDALVEAEAGEWVELETMDDAAVTHRFRIQLDGTNPQYWAGNRWWGEHNSMPWILAYRKGREVALEEMENILRAKERDARMAISYYGKHSELRDAARELVEAVGDVNFDRLCRDKWQRIKAAARTLEGKL